MGVDDSGSSDTAASADAAVPNPSTPEADNEVEAAAADAPGSDLRSRCGRMSSSATPGSRGATATPASLNHKTKTYRNSYFTL